MSKKAAAETEIKGLACAQKLLSVSIVNDVGGTSMLPQGTYRVRVTRSHYDYETGVRMRGELLDPKQIEIARKVGTTGYAKQVGETKKLAKFDPKTVYFSEHNFVAL